MNTLHIRTMFGDEQRVYSVHRPGRRREDAAYRIECFTCEHHGLNIWFGAVIDGEPELNRYKCQLRDNRKPCKYDKAPERRPTPQTDQQGLPINQALFKDGEPRLPLKKVQSQPGAHSQDPGKR